MKRCPKCKLLKKKSDFYKEHRRKDGLSYRCKSCDAEKQRQYEKRKQDAHRQIRRKKECDRMLGMCGPVITDSLIPKKETNKKLCVICEELKVRKDFFIDRQKKDLLSPYCKACNSEKIRQNQDKNKETYLARIRALPRSLGATEKVREWQSNNSHKTKAYKALRRALKSGKACKSEICEFCKSENYIKALYLNYKTPLDVIWLCSGCHNQYSLGVSHRAKKIRDFIQFKGEGR